MAHSCRISDGKNPVRRVRFQRYREYCATFRNPLTSDRPFLRVAAFGRFSQNATRIFRQKSLVRILDF